MRIPVAGREEGSPAQIPLYLVRKRVPWCRGLEAEYDVPRVGVRKEARVLERRMLKQRKGRRTMAWGRWTVPVPAPSAV